MASTLLEKCDPIVQTWSLPTHTLLLEKGRVWLRSFLASVYLHQIPATTQKSSMAETNSGCRGLPSSANLVAYHYLATAITKTGSLAPKAAMHVTHFNIGAPVIGFLLCWWAKKGGISQSICRCISCDHPHLSLEVSTVPNVCLAMIF